MKLYFAMPAALAILAFSAHQATTADIPPAPGAAGQASTAVQNATAQPGAPNIAPNDNRPRLPATGNTTPGGPDNRPVQQISPPASAGVPQDPRPGTTLAPRPSVSVNVTGDNRPDQWRYKFEGNRWWYWTPENRWMIYSDQNGWFYPESTSGYTTGYGGAPVAPQPPDSSVNVVVPGASYTYVPGTSYYYYPRYGYYYPRRFYYGRPGVYVGGPWGEVRVGRWWW